MLWGLNRLKPDEGDLHGAEQSEDEEGVVGDVDPVWEPVHQDQDKDMKRDQVDDEDVSAPSWHLWWDNNNSRYILGFLILGSY